LPTVKAWKIESLSASNKNEVKEESKEEPAIRGDDDLDVLFGNDDGKDGLPF